MLRSALITLALITSCLIAGCGGGSGEAGPPPQSLGGVITDVGVDPAGAVTMLTVVDDAGASWVFAVQWEAGAVRDAQNLRRIRDEKLRVVVHYRKAGDYHIAFRVDDA